MEGLTAGPAGMIVPRSEHSTGLIAIELLNLHL
jgi:hypothetical protein